MEKPGEHKGQVKPTKQRAKNIAKGKNHSRRRTRNKGQATEVLCLEWKIK
jgi:hypothetical protein